jgi:sugar phosphate isomerase/epimerase
MKNRKISVCGWSYRLSAEKIAREMENIAVDTVDLAACPFVDPNAVSPNTGGETELVTGTGGSDPIAKERSDIESFLSSGKWKVGCTLFNSRYDDYTTLESIRATGGLVPDEHWEENRRILADAIKLSAEWKSPYILLHAGYINHADKVGFQKLFDRLQYARDLCADEGIELVLETGQETADDLASLLVNLPGVYVNFDPANMILYGKGDPVKAVKTLAPWIRHIHIKDAFYTKTPGTWGEEVKWTTGEVGAGNFIQALDEIGFDGYLSVEREAGNDRPRDIADAVIDLRNR